MFFNKNELDWITINRPLIETKELSRVIDKSARDLHLEGNVSIDFPEKLTLALYYLLYGPDKFTIELHSVAGENWVEPQLRADGNLIIALDEEIYNTSILGLEKSIADIRKKLESKLIGYWSTPKDLAREVCSNCQVVAKP